MNRYKEISDILDLFFYKDVREIIEDYLFVNCKICKNKITYENAFDSLDNSFYCISCVREKNINCCANCNLYYDISDNKNLICSICFKSCSVFCCKCFKFHSISLSDFLSLEPQILFFTNRDTDNEDSDLDIS